MKNLDYHVSYTKQKQPTFSVFDSNEENGKMEEKRKKSEKTEDEQLDYCKQAFQTNFHLCPSMYSLIMSFKCYTLKL